MIKIQNKHLKDAAEFLQNTITAKGKKNVHRMRIVKALEERDKQLGEEELTLLKDYAKMEGEEFVRTKDGGFDIEDRKGFSEQHKAIFEEYYTIDDTNLQNALKSLEKLVNDFDKELSGKSAEMHFILVEAFEDVEQENTKEGEDKE